MNIDILKIKEVTEMFWEKSGGDCQMLAFCEELSELSAISTKAVKAHLGGHIRIKEEEIRSKALKELADVIFTSAYFIKYFNFSEDEIEKAVKDVTENNAKKLL